jgi:hypothetical protein
VVVEGRLEGRLESRLESRLEDVEIDLSIEDGEVDVGFVEEAFLVELDFIGLQSGCPRPGSSCPSSSLFQP